MGLYWERGRNYITDGLVVVLTMADDWEDDLLDKLEEMLRNMGMPITREQLKGFMNQFKDQFDALGINPEKIAKGEVNFNFDISDISKMFNAGTSVEDLFKNLGMDIRVDAAPVEIDPSALESNDDETMKLPAEDVYLDGWNMSVTSILPSKATSNPTTSKSNSSRTGPKLRSCVQRSPSPWPWLNSLIPATTS